MKQTFGVCRLSSAPLRSEPSDKAEMVSQLLFGDHVEVIEKSERWVKIRMAYDGYEGWMDPKQLEFIDEEGFKQLSDSGHITGLAVCHKATQTKSNQVLYLLPGSSLPNCKDNYFEINGAGYMLESKIKRSDRSKFKTEIEDSAKLYLNAPYLWGGRSPFGVDCSGFTQIVFKQFGIRLKRDAWQQALQGDLLSFLQEAKSGDLAFFDNDEGRIIHVGIMLDNDRIIHASGQVRIDSIDHQGIFNKDLNRYTHTLRVIKRIVAD